jgi:hypothetical protein
MESCWHASRASQLTVGSGRDGRTRPGDLTIAEARKVRTKTLLAPWFLGSSDHWTLEPYDRGTLIEGNRGTEHRETVRPLNHCTVDLYC